MELMMNILNQWFVYGVEALIFIFIFNMFFELKSIYRPIKGVMITVYMIIIVLGEYWNIDNRIIIYYLYIWSCCVYLFKGKRLLKVGIVCVVLSVNLMVETITMVTLSFILKKEYAVINENLFISQTVVQCIKLIILLIVANLYVTNRKNSGAIKYYLNQIGGFQRSLFLVMPLSSIAVTLFLFDSINPYFMGRERILIGSIVVGLILALNILVFIYTNKTLANKEAEYKAENMEELLHIHFEHYKQLEEINSETRAIKHDIRNHLLCLKNLLENKKIEEARQYLSDITMQLEVTKMQIATGDAIIDAVLEQKYKEAKAHQISLDVKGKFIGEVPLEAIDKCTLIANALDNAVEACLKMDEIAQRKIELTIEYNKNYLFITIKNPIKEKLEIKDNTIKTSKADKKKHGFGLEHIKGVVEKYNGFINLYCEENIFVEEIIFNIATATKSE